MVSLHVNQQGDHQHEQDEVQVHSPPRRPDAPPPRPPCAVFSASYARLGNWVVDGNGISLVTVQKAAAQTDISNARKCYYVLDLLLCD